MSDTQHFIENHQKRLPFLQPSEFEKVALEVFRFQAVHNPVYALYLQTLKIKIEKVEKITQIPFLPINFFQNFEVRSAKRAVEAVFESSGTTGQVRSRHYVSDLGFYQRNSKLIFEQFYGQVADYQILALLPSYAERSNSSLVYMIQYFQQFAQPESGFYLYNFEELHQKIKILQERNQKILLIGVTFALLDFAEQHSVSLQNGIVMETGGMKGRRRELLREEVHAILTNRLGVQVVHSEYGMTEMLSQGYSTGGGWFRLPAWCKVLLRELNDPFEYNPSLRYGGINMIDLANIESCCFIETQDIGRLSADQQLFQVLGRFDHAELRGCNLMVS